MRVCTSSNSLPARLRSSAVLALGCLWLWSGLAAAPDRGTEGFVVHHVTIKRVERVYQLDANVDYRFSPEVLEALDSGVPLTLSLHIEVLRERRYLWDEVVAQLEQRFLLEFHALTKQYLVRNLNANTQANYLTLAAALTALGTVSGLPMLDTTLVQPGEDYRVRVRARLDIEALPAPLRPMAYISSKWRLASQWHAWPLPR